MALLVNAQAGIVVGVIHPAFIVDDGRTRHHSTGVIIIGHHIQQVPFAFFGPAVYKKGFVRFFAVDGHGHMVGGIRSQPAGVFVAVFRFLSQFEPYTPVAVVLLC